MPPSTKKQLAAMKSALRTAYGSGDIGDEVYNRLLKAALDVPKSVQPPPELTCEIEYPPPPKDCVLVDQMVDESAAPDVPTDSTQAAMNPAQPARQEAEASANAQDSAIPQQEVNEAAMNRDGLECQNSKHEETLSDSKAEAMTSCLFLWCRGCRVLFAFMSKERDLPHQIVTTTKFKDAVVLFLCGACKVKRNSMTTGAVRNGFDSWNMSRDESITAEEVAIDVHPDVWAGTEACMAASVMIGRDVRVLDNGKNQTACADGLEVLRSMQPGEVAGKVDMEGFRTGIKGMRLFGHFEGGCV